MDAKTTAIAKINNVDIVMINDGEKRIAVKPICDALGIDYNSQFSRIKEDEILSELCSVCYTVAADGKEREMLTIPLEFVFGWIFSINSKKVAPDVHDQVVKYKKECYHALYAYFTRHDEYLEYRQQRMSESFAKQFEARNNFAYAKVLLQEANIDFRKWMTYNEDDFLADKAQLQLDFSQGKEGKEA